MEKPQGRAIFFLSNTAGRINNNHLSSLPAEHLYWRKSAKLASRDFQVLEGSGFTGLPVDFDSYTASASIPPSPTLPVLPCLLTPRKELESVVFSAGC